MKWLYLSLVKFFALKSTLSDIKSHSSFPLMNVNVVYFFSILLLLTYFLVFIFNVCFLSLDFFFYPVDSLCLFIVVFAFSEFINMAGFASAIWLFVFSLNNLFIFPYFFFSCLPWLQFHLTILLFITYNSLLFYGSLTVDRINLQVIRVYFQVIQ